MSDAELYRELMAARAAAGPGLLRDPATLAHGLDPRYRSRPHLRLISQALVGLERGAYDRLLVTTPPQVGKPVCIGSMILMGDGSRKKLADIAIGDMVITHRGRPKRVTAVHEQGEQECVRIVTDGGRETVAALDHPFLTPEGWVNAGELQPGIALATVPRPDIKVTSGLTEAEAYLLGGFVGDGSVSQQSASITCFSDSMVEKFQESADELGFLMRLRDSPTSKGRRSYSFRSKSRTRKDQENGVRAWLKKHDLAGRNSHTKHVPHDVFTARPSVVASFIAGYWDCDGSVSYRGIGRDGKRRTDVHAELNSVSRGLLEEVQHLLLRLGIRSKIRTKKGTYKDSEHISYRLQIISKDDVSKFKKLIPLAHEVKSQRLKEHPFPRTDFDGPFLSDPIISVERIGNRECRCLTVEDDHTFTSDDLVVHNSYLTSEWLPLWWLALHPADRIVVASYADSLAHVRGKKVRALVEEHGHEFGLHLQYGSTSVQDWGTTAGGGMRSVGVGAGLTGHPSNLAIIDDPHKDRSEAESARIRQGVHDWYSSTLLTRLQPDRSAVVIVQTRWHPDDLAGRRLDEEGRLEEGGRWKVVHLPAVADRKFGTDPLGRAPGEPLTHPKIPTADVEARRRWWADKQASVAPRDWHALYQGDPQPAEGTLLPKGLLKQRTHIPVPASPVKTGVAVDPSGGGRDTAGIIGGHLADDGRLYLTHDESVTGPSEAWGRAACELAAEIDADFVIVESNFGGDQASTVIRLSWARLAQDHPDDERYRRLPPRVRTVHAKKGKLLRAEPIAQQISDDRMRLGAYLPLLIHEWEHWQSTDPDSPGRIDASVYLAYDLLPVPGAEAVISAPTGVKITRAGGSSGGGRGGGGGQGGGRIQRSTRW